MYRASGFPPVCRAGSPDEVIILCYTSPRMPTVIETLTAYAFRTISKEEGKTVFPAFQERASRSAIPPDLALVFPYWNQNHVIPAHDRDPNWAFKLLASYAFETDFGSAARAMYAVLWSWAIAQTKLWQTYEAHHQLLHDKLTLISQRFRCSVDEIPERLLRDSRFMPDDITAIRDGIALDATVKSIRDNAIQLCGHSLLAQQYLKKESRDTIQETIEAYYTIPSHRQRLAYLALSCAGPMR